MIDTHRVIWPKNKVFIDTGYGNMYIGIVKACDENTVVLEQACSVPVGNMKDVLEKGILHDHFAYPLQDPMELSRDRMFATLYRHPLPKPVIPFIDVMFPSEREG